MIRYYVAWIVLTVIAGIGILASAQGPAGEPIQLEILSPTPGSYVNGPTVLRARVEPANLVSSVVFFADGRQVCTLTAFPFECQWDAGRAIVERQVRVVANIAAGGRIARAVRTKGAGYAENVDVDAVQVTVTVTDGRGRFVDGLPQSAFRVYEDGQRQTISHFGSEAVPLELIVAVDISGSMSSAMPKLKIAVKEFLRSVPRQNPVTLLAFNDTVFSLSRQSTDLSDRIKAVDRLASWGGTALYDVILRGVDMLRRETGRKAIVVFSDGEDEGSHAVIEDVERRLQASDVTLYMIALGRGLTMETLKKVMQRLVSPTGGRALLTESIDELQLAFNDLLEELSHQYLLSYPPTNTTHNDAWRSIKVDVDGRYQVRARQGYRASTVR
jgi:Ca-activated chloride channel family protein